MFFPPNLMNHHQILLLASFFISKKINLIFFKFIKMCVIVNVVDFFLSDCFDATYEFVMKKNFTIKINGGPT